MKEATGELNMTVVTIVAIAALLGFFYLVVWPTIQTGMALNSACNAAGGAAYSTTLEDGSKINCTVKSSTGVVTCKYTGANGSSSSKTCE